MKYFYIIFGCLLAASCNNDDTNNLPKQVIKPNKFILLFKPINSVLSIEDSSLVHVIDTLKILPKTAAQFINDSLVNTWLGGDKKATINPIGRIEKTTETYLIIAVTKLKKTGVIALVYDANNAFVAYKFLIDPWQDSKYKYSVSINKEPTFITKKEVIINAHEVKYTKTAWAYSASKFIVVLNESNERSSDSLQIQNPIDTFPSFNDYSGLYSEDEQNFISVKDGFSKKNYLFFLHTDKNEGTCIGELKGEINLTDSGKGTYQFQGDPCVIDFTFTDNYLTFKEKGSCGNRRGMDCFFEGSFERKKVAQKYNGRLPKPLPIAAPALVKKKAIDTILSNLQPTIVKPKKLKAKKTISKPKPKPSSEELYNL
jgi:hypothetical protein